MEKSTEAVKAPTETAATQSETVVTPTTTEVDYEAVIAAKDARLAKIEAEKENYRRGLLKAKGKTPTEELEVDENTGETTEQMMRRIAREESMNSEEAQLRAEKDDAYKSLLKRNKELELAFKNRNQIGSGSGQGSNQDRQESKIDSYFSDEQLKALRAKGYDDKKIEALKQNMIKGNNMPSPIIR